MSLSDVTILVGALIFIVLVTLAMRARERQVRQLLTRFGRSTTATVIAYTESDDGFLLTYTFTPTQAGANIERTEILAARPRFRPQPGQPVPVTYLPSLPSVSRAAIEGLQ